MIFLVIILKWPVKIIDALETPILSEIPITVTPEQAVPAAAGRKMEIKQVKVQTDNTGMSMFTGINLTK